MWPGRDKILKTQNQPRHVSQPLGLLFTSLNDTMASSAAIPTRRALGPSALTGQPWASSVGLQEDRPLEETAAACPFAD